MPKFSPTTFISNISPALPTEVFDAYWRFAAERQEIFFKKLQGLSRPWTGDPILNQYKFTNAYRASDRVSQYMIRNVIYQGDQTPIEVFFRTILFRVFNRIETWELLRSEIGSISYAEYSFKHYDNILTKTLNQGKQIFSAAYIMPSGTSSFGSERKHRNFLKLLQLMIENEVPASIAQMRNMQQAFDLLHSYPMIGDFLAYQFVIDLNYSEMTHFSEMEFVIPGPGARDGIHKCFKTLGGLNEAEIIKLMAELQEKEFERLGLCFKSLWGRRLQLIDCQNLFCEVDKYARLAHPHIKGLSGRTRIKQIYRSNRTKIEYWYPPKWGLNTQLDTSEITN